jgi:hypothetical protein
MSIEVIRSIDEVAALVAEKLVDKEGKPVDFRRVQISDYYGSCQYSRVEDTHRLVKKVGLLKFGVTLGHEQYKEPTEALLDSIKEELEALAKDDSILAKAQLHDDKYRKWSLDEIAQFSEAQGWDLWSVALMLYNYQCPDTKVPEWVEKADSIETGIACYLLVEKCGMTIGALSGMST